MAATATTSTGRPMMMLPFVIKKRAQAPYGVIRDPNKHVFRDQQLPNDGFDFNEMFSKV